MIDSSRNTLTSRPAKGLNGELRVPGDKSISHRAVILGSIAEGTTEIEGFLAGDDNLATVAALKALGVNIVELSKTRLTVHGCGIGALTAPTDAIDAHNSGTTARLLTGLLASLPFDSLVTGDSSLRKRPMKRVVEPLTLMGAEITGENEASRLPLSIKGTKLKGISYKTPVPSAQVKSAILLAGLNAEGETTVIETALSRDHTERMLALFGADIVRDGLSVTVKSANPLQGSGVVVPGDISSAAFFMVGAAITPSSELVLKNVGTNPTRTGIMEILKEMEVAIEVRSTGDVSGEPVAEILVRSSELKAVEIDGTELLRAIDEFPAICVAAAFAKGTTTIRGASELRVKESDRIAVMAASLGSLGVECEELPDGIVIEGSAGAPLRGGVIESHGDHRISMAMAVAALNTVQGVEIDDATCVDVSFPGFFEALDRVRK